MIAIATARFAVEITVSDPETPDFEYSMPDLL